MPRSRFIKKVSIDNSYRVNKIKNNFDFSGENVETSFDIDIPIEDKIWNIGLIVGSSGSGKTTIAKECFKDFYFFSGFDWNNKPIVDEFPSFCSVDDIVNALTSVGYSAVPDWLKPFHVLSNGQKMRVELARLLFETDKPIIYDEFTSVVDRTVAKTTSSVLSKRIRTLNKQFIALSCHRDIVDWLNPDWIYDTDLNQFQWRCLRPRPQIELKIRTAKHEEWGVFSKYHYLTSDHSRSAKCFIAEYDGMPIAFCSVLHFPFGNVPSKRVHRIVVHPDYQGLGIGTTLLCFVAEYVKQKYKCKLRITTSLTKFARSIAKNKRWSLTRQGHNNDPATLLNEKAKSVFQSGSYKRYTYGFVYN